MRVEEMRESVTTSTTHQYFHSWVQHRNMQLHFSVTFACCGNVEILVSTWCKAEVVQNLKMILGKNYWCADSPGLQVCKSSSLQVCKSASLQVCKSAVCKCRTPRDPAFPRVFSRRSAILKIVEEKALGTRLVSVLLLPWVSCSCREHFALALMNFELQ